MRFPMLRFRIRRFRADLRDGAEAMPGVFRVMLDLGGPLGILLYKLDGSLDRRVR